MLLKFLKRVLLAVVMALSLFGSLTLLSCKDDPIGPVIQSEESEEDNDDDGDNDQD